MVELRSNFIAEQPTSTTGTDGPGLDFFRVAPDEITKGAFVGDLLRSRDHADLVDGSDFRAETTVDAEYLAVHDRSQYQEIENLATGLPDGGVAVLLLALLVEAVHLGDLAGLVIPAH